MNPQSPADEELLAAWRAGDLGAGNELFRRHFATIYSFFRNKVSSGHRDLVQRTFLGCVENRDLVPPGVAFRSYLLGIAHKQLLRQIRKHERERRAMAGREVLGEESLRSPSRVAVAQREQRVLLRALRELPLELQVVIELYYWEDVKTADIAVITGVAPGTVKSRLARARELLLDAIARVSESEEIRRSTVDGLERWARSLRAALASPDETDA